MPLVVLASAWGGGVRREQEIVILYKPDIVLPFVQQLHTPPELRSTPKHDVVRRVGSPYLNPINPIYR